MSDGGGFWSSLGQGLQSAGAILSPTVAASQQQEYMLKLQQAQRQRELMATQIMAGIQNGSVDAQAGQETLKRLGMSIPGLGPSPTAQNDQMMLKLNQQALGGGGPGGGGLGLPGLTTPPAAPGTAPGGAAAAGPASPQPPQPPAAPTATEAYQRAIQWLQTPQGQAQASAPATAPRVTAQISALRQAAELEQQQKTANKPQQHLNEKTGELTLVYPDGHVESKGIVQKPSPEPKSEFQRLLAELHDPNTPPEDKKAIQARLARMDAPPRVQVNTGSQFGGERGDLMAALAERGVSLPAGFRSKDQQVALLNGLIKRNPDLTPDQIAEKVRTGQLDLSNMRAEGRTAAGIAGKVSYAEQELEQTIPLVREASKNVPRGKFVPYTKIKQMGEKAFSDPDLKELAVYMTSLSNAYDMLAARGGTDKDKRAHAREMFETADSPEALERALRAVENEAKASGVAAKNSMGSAAGRTPSAPAAAAPRAGNAPPPPPGFTPL